LVKNLNLLEKYIKITKNNAFSINKRSATIYFKPASSAFYYSYHIYFKNKVITESKITSK
jgi:hypothetical protein